jgi:hypothetical protein
MTNKEQTAKRSARRSNDSLRLVAPKQNEVPTKVVVSYKSVSYGPGRRLHVFESADYPGLHSADLNLKRAFDGIGNAVSAYMAAQTAIDARYAPGITYAQFAERLKKKQPAGTYETTRRVRQVQVTQLDLVES